jgi:hypothetical protein
LTASLKSQRKRIPQGLARVRKAVPPPGKVFKNKKRDTRQRAKKDLRQRLEESILLKSS